MRLLFLAALLAAGEAVSSAHAEAYENKSIPTYVETPAGFTIRPAAIAGYDLALRIDSTGNSFRPARGETRLCDVLFIASRSEQTQQWFNERWNDEVVASDVRRPYIAHLHLKSETPFELGDVKGIEHVGPVRRDKETIAMASLVLTLRGLTGLYCMLRAEQAEAGLPVTRSIRAAIRPPK